MTKRLRRIGFALGFLTSVAGAVWTRTMRLSIAPLAERLMSMGLSPRNCIHAFDLPFHPA